MPLIPNMPARDYHAKPGASASRLKLLRERSPLHVRYATDNPSPATPALILGDALHTKVLEPDQYGKRYVVAGTCNATKADGKPCTNDGRVFDGSWWCGVHGKGRTADEGRRIISGDENIAVHSMERAILAHPYASALLNVASRREVSAFWRDAMTGCECKARIDAMSDALIVDLKTCEDASPDGFARQIAAYGYDLQARHYMASAEAAGVDVTDFFFVAVEKVAPFAVGVYRITDQNLQAVDATWRRLLETYHRCATSGKWPGYSEAEDIQVPGWQMKRLEVA